MQLEALQKSMMDAIDRGPDFIAEAAFAGGRPAAMRGLCVHANTISHARLVALEESFPRGMEQLGHERFNALCRQFLETGSASAEPLGTIGRDLPSFLADEGERDAAATAQFEWAWLESYHAAEAVPLVLADLAGLAEDRLLATTVSLHPAARLVPPNANSRLIEEVPTLAYAAGILITRPHADVLISPADAAMIRYFRLLEENFQPVCNLLASAHEHDGEDGLQSLLAMLIAGSLVLAVQQG